MSQIVELQQGQYYWLYDKTFLESISPQLFQHEYWFQQEAVTGVEKGRGTTLFIAHGEHQFVLRHYLRGGLVSKINKDKYFFRNWKRCRSITEFYFLNDLVELGLPVPRPVAAQVLKKGTRYRADILVERIDGAIDLLGMLRDVSQSEGFYQTLAKVIARFHLLGIYHADLNIQNILIDDHGKFWLIDFDRAKRLTPHTEWQQRTISRLKRSFEKEQGRHGIHWNAHDWIVFEDAYEAAMEAGL